MILDSSPLVAIFGKEPDSEIYVDAISRRRRHETEFKAR